VTAARRALVCLDLTDLDAASDATAVERLCRRAQSSHGFVAAVCVWPRFVDTAAAALRGTGIHVATVVNFPDGDAPLQAVEAETNSALAAGADEIDLVVPWRQLVDGRPEAVTETVRAVKAVCGPATLKAILETGALADPARIGSAAQHALGGGADFLKTSTGKIAGGATLEAAEILLRAIERGGTGAGLKVSGGIRTLGEAGEYLALCDRVMGAGWAGPKHFRIGASGLMTELLAALADTNDDPDS
jgi:deoxyribose-phosphate aldolase